VRPAKVQETILGVDLANNILETLAAKLDVGEIKGEKFGLATAKLDAAVALLTKIREVAEHTHSSALRALLLRHELQNLDTIPTFQKLYRYRSRYAGCPGDRETRCRNPYDVDELTIRVTNQYPAPTLRSSGYMVQFNTV